MKKDQYAYLMVLIQEKVELRYVSMDTGVQCVVLDGMKEML